MTLQIIIRGKNLIGKKRSEITENLRKDGWGTGGLSDEQLDVCKFLEKKFDQVGFIPGQELSPEETIKYKDY